jgi:hypothetical protein
MKLEANSAISTNYQEGLEARGRIELPHKGFADLSLTTWVPRLKRRETERLSNKNSGAGNGIRTRDFDLGKVALYH